MTDDKLTSMLERATDDPPHGYAAALLRATAAPESAEAPHAEPYVLAEPPRRRRRGRLLVGAAAAVLAAVVAAGVVTLNGNDDAAPAANADGLAVVVNGKPVPVKDLDVATQRVAEHGGPLNISEDERPLHAAATVLFERFLGDLGRAEGEPVTEADIDRIILDSSSIWVHGESEPVDPDEALADPEFRALIRHGQEVFRGMAVLTERFGTPTLPDTYRQWRTWFAEQVDTHGASVTVHGERIPNEDVADAIPLSRPF